MNNYNANEIQAEMKTLTNQVASKKKQMASESRQHGKVLEAMSNAEEMSSAKLEQLMKWSVSHQAKNQDYLMDLIKLQGQLDLLQEMFKFSA